MRLQRQSNEQIITLNLSSTLGHGGEARVYAVPQDESLAAKVYHKPTDVHAHKLVAMLANPPENPMAGQGHISIAWPVDLLRTVGSDTVVGFLMPRVKAMHSLLDFYNPKTRRQNCPFFNYLYLHRTASNLAAAVSALHARGYCIADLNESNILVSNTALVTLVDTDSFQVRDPDNGVVYRCRVGKSEFTPPELQGKSFYSVDRAIAHDLFGLAVLIFQLLMEGTHPFSGIFQGTGDPPPYEARIAAGHFCYSRGRRVPYIPTPIALPLEILHPTLQQLFVLCFEDGHNNPQMRPSAQTWQAALKEAQNSLVTCSANLQHRYGSHLSACPWCERTLALGGRDPFPSQQAVQSKQHLQPLLLKRVTQPTKSYATPSIPTPKPLLLVTIPQNKRFSSFVLGLLGVAVFGSLEALVIFSNDLNFAQKTNAPPVATTTDTAEPSLTTTSGTGSVAYYKLGDYEGALENFSKALRLNPNDAKAYVRRGNARYELAQYSKDPDKDYQGAISDFDQALSLNPDEAEAYLRRGIVRYEIAQYSKDPDKDYQGAISDFNQALRLNPQLAEAYVKRGIVRYKMAQHKKDSNTGYKEAILDFNQALRLNPQLAEAYVKRGIVRYELAQYSKDPDRDYREAILDFNQALLVDPQSVEAYVNRSIVRYELAQYGGDNNKYYWGAVEDLHKATLFSLKKEK